MIQDCYVPTPQDQIQWIINAVQLTKGEKHLDFGSGDGRIVSAGKELGAESEGVEIDSSLVNLSRNKGLIIHEVDYWSFEISSYDVITTGNIDDGLRELVLEKFHKEAKPNARLALGFPGLIAKGLTIYTN